MKVPAGWYVILSSRELKPDKPQELERFGQKFVAWRNSAGKAIVMSNVCPHRSVNLSLGYIKNDCIVCPFHGFEFDSSGVCQFVPETKKSAVNLKLQNYSLIEKHGFVWMRLGDFEDDNVPWFPELENERLQYSELSDLWPIHISRCVENQLDYAHLPYLHRNTIGRRFDVSIKREFELSEKSIALKFEGGGGGLEFKFPNIWMLKIKKDRFYQMLAFAPVNEHSTRLYVRAYQGFVRLDLIKPLIDKVFNLQNTIILNQDKYAVVSQSPNSSLDASQENLYPSDRGIAWYRQKWKETETMAK
jgi:phenylpropionate dioxygenase-like ring-hydroxylating dioxygenase large terminal subunit